MLFGKLMLQKPNVLVMDEPTNHLDMESIEALNSGLEKFPGTLIFVFGTTAELVGPRCYSAVSKLKADARW